MNKTYVTNLKANLNRSKQERKAREGIKGDLLVMSVALAAIILFIVII